MRYPIFTLGGIFLILWSIANTYIDITRYGLDWGLYWWFCNLALFGMGVGLLIRSRGVLAGFLSIACFTQVFWLIDNLTRQFRGAGVFGLIDFMYRPGYPMDEFVLSHYHYFTMPIALVALFFLPQKPSPTVKLIAIFNPFIFGVSYFVFPASHNINCIHEACFKGLSWSGPVYSFFFWAIIFAVHLVIGWFIEKVFTSIRITPERQRYALTAFAGFVALGLGVAVQDTRYKLSLPSFACAEPEQFNGVLAGCQYTRIHQNGQFMLTYFVENQQSEGRLCRVKLSDGKSERLLSAGIPLVDTSRITQNETLDNPTEDTVVKVVADCSPMPTTVSAVSPN